jgi:hypothetical protein
MTDSSAWFYCKNKKNTLKKAERKFIHVYNSPQLQAARAA